MRVEVIVVCVVTVLIMPQIVDNLKGHLSYSSPHTHTHTHTHFATLINCTHPFPKA